MRGIGIFLKNKIKNVDPILFGATAFLSFMSLLTIFGAVDNFGRSKLKMQIAMTLLGLVMAIGTKIKFYESYSIVFCFYWLSCMVTSA